MVVEFAETHRGADRNPTAQAISLYYAVREAVRYNPYAFSRDPATLRGSKCYPHLFADQLPQLLGDMQSDLSRD